VNVDLSQNIKGVHFSEWLRKQKAASRMFFLIGIVGGGIQLGPLGSAATNGLLCQPRVIMMMAKLVE
jgi:hypothetical protein